MCGRAEPIDLVGELIALFEALDVAVMRFDAEGRCTRANEAARAVFGDVEGASWIDLVDAEDQPVARVARLEASEQGRASFEARAVRRDGGRFEAEITMVRAGSGHHQVVRDVGERRRQAARIAEIEAASARRERAFEELMSAAAHDLKEPVRKVAAFAALLDEGSSERLDDTGRDYLARIRRAAGRMERLLRDLGALGRVATATLPFSPVDLGEAARAAIAELGDAAGDAPLRATIDALPVVEADPFQMTQLFACLVGNAIRFRKPGEPAVVRIAASAQADVVLVTVSDEGIGFEQADAERIFRPFERLHGRGAHDGSGLGLAICRAIVERHGGAISAQGTPGGGATFTVTLPIRRAEGATRARRR